MSSSQWLRRGADRRSRFDADDPGAAAAFVVSTATLAVAFSLLALGVDWFWVAFPVGYGGVLPIAVARAKARADATTAEGDHDVLADREQPTDEDVDAALASVRDRYARGEFDDAEMEARITDVLAAAVGERAEPSDGDEAESVRAEHEPADRRPLVNDTVVVDRD